MFNLHQMLGLPKSQIIGQLTERYVEFGVWLYVPALSVLLSFDKQCCVAVDWL